MRNMSFKPADYQEQPFPWSSYIQPLSLLEGSHEDQNMESSNLELDVLFVGGGPAGLSGAIYLKHLCQDMFPDIQIGVLEKAEKIGGHSLSGAIVNPVVFHKLFPQISLADLPFRKKVSKESLFYFTKKKKYPLPLPPTMKNKNFYTASLCEVVRWMADRAEEKEVLLLPSFTAHQLLVEEKYIKGVTTFPTGLSKNDLLTAKKKTGVSIKASLTVLADGSRGHLSQAWMHWKNISSQYAQTYALGVKELWEVPAHGLGYDFSNRDQVIHTMGWPLPMDCFGGAWLYPMGEGLLSLGLVAGLDSRLQNLDVHLKLQELKNHPWIAQILEGGKCVEWGAKTIPEGGYHAIPKQLHDHGLLIAGDCAGMVNVPALKGIHYAMTAGILAAETAFCALKKKDFSANILKKYDHKIHHQSCVRKELYPVRNVRQAFQKNFFVGLIKSGLMFLTRGLFPNDTVSIPLTAEQSNCADSKKIRTKKTTYTKNAKFLNKTDAVYLSNNQTRDDILPHLKTTKKIPENVQKFYETLCPAGVYESQNGELVINASNCIDCKATDVLGPRWSPKEGGTGPRYRRM